MEIFIVFVKEKKSIISEIRAKKPFIKFIPCQNSDEKIWLERISVIALDKKEAKIMAKCKLVEKDTKVISLADYENGKFYEDSSENFPERVIEVRLEEDRPFIPKKPYKNNAEGLMVTSHAIKRFREKSESQKTSEQIAHRLLSWMEIAKELIPKKHFGTIALLNHDFQEAKYYKHGNWIMVVCNKKLVTIHHGEAGRWREK